MSPRRPGPPTDMPRVPVNGRAWADTATPPWLRKMSMSSPGQQAPPNMPGGACERWTQSHHVHVCERKMSMSRPEYGAETGQFGAHPIVR
jgi:hypothetical protein